LDPKSTPTEQLTDKGIRPSFQRLKVLEYLHHCCNHPTAEEIYTELSPEIPSLSLATIYNTLHTFVEASLVRELTFDTDVLRYDSILEDHGHFQCTSCGKIFNFTIDLEGIPADGLDGFQVVHKNVYYTGLCPDCQSQTKS
jgi:Fur family peroxide stress response transcriptional regulator